MCMLLLFDVGQRQSRRYYQGDHAIRRPEDNFHVDRLLQLELPLEPYDEAD